MSAPNIEYHALENNGCHSCLKFSRLLTAISFQTFCVPRETCTFARRDVDGEFLALEYKMKT